MAFESKWNWQEEVPILAELSASGMTLTEIAQKYEVTKQRIKQIFTKFKIPQVGLKKKAYEAGIRYQQKWGTREDSELYRVQREKFRRKKHVAPSMGWEFTIDFGDIDWPSHCPILGIELDYFAETRQENSISFDRIDPTKGYVKGNVEILSWRANRIKNDGTAEEHRYIAAHMDRFKEK